MKKKLFVLLITIIVLTAAIPVLARNDNVAGRVDGVWCYTPDLTEFTILTIGDYAGEKMFASTVETGNWTGLFTGTSTDYGTLQFLTPADPGPTLFMGTVTFDEVVVSGKTGSLEMDVIGSRADAVSDWEGSWTITGGTDELENLQGNGRWWGPGWLGNPDECGVIYYRAKHIRFP